MKPRNENTTIIIIVAILIAFGLGTGIGITMGISGDDPSVEETNNTPIPINVTNNLSAYENHSNIELEEVDDVEEDVIYNNTSAIYYPKGEFYNNSTNGTYEY
ncbi:MAG: hypothetical protein KO202_02730 [Methanobacteriaceae archaeon]|jgi:hypothetical protein|nr:hypothetical protein [Methanobacteriaceae archaeon]